MAPPNMFEADIDQEPAALRAFASARLPGELGQLDLDGYDRIVLTGMGASHFAARHSWLSLISEGRPAWWVSTAELLGAPELLSGRVLVWATSQSGESGEVVALLERGRTSRTATLLATTNVPTSTLGRAADVVVALAFGEEAAVSTKSYISTLAAHYRALNALRHGDDAPAVERIAAVADQLEGFRPDLGAFAARALGLPSQRFAFIGTTATLENALIGALLSKEVAKLPAEGYLAGEFRHGPIELAGPGLVAVVFGTGTDDKSLSGLALELVRSEALLLPVDTATAVPLSSWAVATGAPDGLGRSACGAKLAQLLAGTLARARGIEPGEFRFGQKVTASI